MSLSAFKQDVCSQLDGSVNNQQPEPNPVQQSHQPGLTKMISSSPFSFVMSELCTSSSFSRMDKMCISNAKNKRDD